MSNYLLSLSFIWKKINWLSIILFFICQRLKPRIYWDLVSKIALLASKCDIFWKIDHLFILSFIWTENGNYLLSYLLSEMKMDIIFYLYLLSAKNTAVIYYLYLLSAPKMAVIFYLYLLSVKNMAVIYYLYLLSAPKMAVIFHLYLFF